MARRQKEKKIGGGGKEADIDSFPVPSADPEYEISICLWFKAESRCGGDNKSSSVEFYALNMCSSEEKEVEDRQKEELEKIIRGPRAQTYLSFHHYKRHEADQVSPVPVLPLLQDYQKKPNYNNSALIAVMGSNLYRLGGSRPGLRRPDNTHLSRKVIYFDINRPADGWKKSPYSMISGRDSSDGAQAVALNGMLYVFGGRPLDVDGGHWAEVFDPSSCSCSCSSSENHENENCCWTPLPPPPVSPLSGCDPFAAVIDSDTILLGSALPKSLLFTYHVIANCWETHDQYSNSDDSDESYDPDPDTEYVDFHYYNYLRLFLCGPRRRYGAPVVVGSTVYWVGHGIYAYDTDKERFYWGPIGDLNVRNYLFQADNRHDPTCVEIPILLHLAGDLFCLIWLSHLRCPVKGWRSHLHCTKFRVYNLSTEADMDDDTSEERESLFAFVESCRFYDFENDQVTCLAGYQFK